MTFTSRFASRQRGLALLVVLWLMVIVALQMSVFGVATRDSVLLAQNELAIARGESLVSAAVEIAAARLTDPDPARRWVGGNQMRTVDFAGATLQIRIRDQSGLIDLNSADEQLLLSLFSRYTSVESARQLVDRVLDWRDADQESRRMGAEERDYRRANLGYTPADGPFIHATELLRVLGMPRGVAHAILPLVTVFGRDGKVNPAIAPREVLLALPGISEADVEAATRLRQQGGESALQLPAVLAPAGPWLSSRIGPAYSLAVEVRSEAESVIGSLEAMIIVGVDADAPYRVLKWHYQPRAFATEEPGYAR